MTEGGAAIGEPVGGVPANPAAAARTRKTRKTARTGAAAASLLDAGDGPTTSVSQQIQGRPLMTFLVGLALGAGIASLWGSQRR